ncbi:MAG: transcriptional regulator [Leptolyngbyaceae cyanobacterium SM2_5_2]|nr:transcriptional regulator [Leptolyngbyaceae cyanobacterium SM2_5_2]
MPVRDYKSYLLVQLADPDYAALYLKASLEETLQDGDTAAFMLALRDVVEARRGTEANLDDLRQALDLDGEEAPTLSTLISVLSAVGLTLEFKAA